MFTKAYTLLSEETWEKAPNTNNPVEGINKQSIPEKGNSLEPLLENIYPEERVQAAKVVAAGKNVSLSYRAILRKQEGGEMIIGNLPKMKSF